MHPTDMSCEGPKTVHTIGHSTRSIEVFVELLRAHRIARVVDVRRWPTSTRFPHFAKARLTESLAAAGIEYIWREDLGGYRKPSPDSPRIGWRVGAFRAYADFMLTEDFERILGEVQEVAATRRTALMCAEAVPWRCHRQLLADAFSVRGWSVRHILDDRCEEHALTPFARPRGTRILYDGASSQRPKDGERR